MLSKQALRQSLQTRRLLSSRVDVASREYQFLQESEIPSYHFQKSLRRLPIPKLDDTCDRYLAAAKAIFNEVDYKHAEKLVRIFQDGEGKELQTSLIAMDNENKQSSYISEPWFDMYLRSRVPVPVNFNPFMMYAVDQDPRYNDQAIRATNFIISFARFKRSLDANILNPEVYHVNPKKSDTALFRTVCKTLPSRLSWFGAVAFKAFPLDMSQYKSLFNGSRIPKKEKDVLHHCPDAKHFVVMRGGRIYAVDLFDKDDNVLAPELVYASIRRILEDKSEAPADSCVGSLTTLDRDTWASVRDELISSSEDNLRSIKAVDDALFTICLDSNEDNDPRRLVESLLIGDEGRNRWFDKCFQLIVDANGQATINFEHSWGDGVAVLRLMEESFKDTNTKHFVGPETKSSGEGAVKELTFKLSDSLKSHIVDAQKKHVAANSDIDFATVEYFDMNRESIKNSKLSPDSVMQLAIQLAFYRQYKEFVPTYESCSTAAYLKGRTEVVRSATSATREAVLAIEAGKSNIRELITKCSKDHQKLVMEAAMGQGFDRHLLGLKITAERQGQAIPELFEDRIYKRMGHYVLSTSTLSTETLQFGGFGPVVPDGFGIGYNVVPSKLGAVITARKGQRDASAFSKNMTESLDTLKSIIENVTQVLNKRLMDFNPCVTVKNFSFPRRSPLSHLPWPRTRWTFSDFEPMTPSTHSLFVLPNPRASRLLSHRCCHFHL
ncbi:hypothetical protein QR680_018521 [Steinernema hermaphroditum]|uniref:Choline/carnitine acyltransferase domain-containing protein n=1 Tax=Steinernema hermaphroditum TaxID=289476 RepID=A0AA39HJ23_9BILA|nr:hypothetical protein QR680_018521 [Steinernema hermaphroditum]